jgi:hypothetical protein
MFHKIQLVGQNIMASAQGIPFNEFSNRIVGANTFRTFHRIDANGPGPKELFMDFLMQEKDRITSGLKSCKEIQEIDRLSEELHLKLKEKLSLNVKGHILKNYNAVRKLVDLTLEHMGLLSDQLCYYREDFIHFLRVPLDSYILNSSCLFSYDERKKYGLGKLGSGFMKIESLETYYEIQTHLRKLASSEKIDHSIYFDALWRDRINFKINILE